jgi:peptide/nickel transport system substrate-binding protein
MPDLVITMAKVDALPPTRVTDDTSILTIKRLVFEPLVNWDRGHAYPGLFASWTHDAEGRRWHFQIRPDAVFHDGVPCRAAHVLDFIEGILASVDMFGMKWSYARYLARTRITAASDSVVLVESEHPFADILDIFSEFYIARIAPDGRATLGTGAFQFTELTPHAQAILEARDGRAGQVRRITLDCEPEAEARWAHLQEGRADVAMQLDHMRKPPARDGQFRWLSAVSTLSVMYYLNCYSGAFMAPEARLAANLAVDKEALVRDVFGGNAAVSSTIVGPAHLGMAAGDIAPIAYDPDQARALLDASHVSRDLLLRTPTHMPEHAPEISRFVAEALERVGFHVRIETEHDRPEYARQVGRKEIGDLSIFDSSPHSSFRVLDDKISSASQAVWWQGYHDAKVQELIPAASSAVAPQAREAAYAACLRRLNESPPWLYLVHPIALAAARLDAPTISLDAKGTLAFC